MSKQTATEWLVDQLECFGNKHELQMSWATVDELVDQAKEMEKDQIIEAFFQGVDRESDGHGAMYLGRKDAEQYYNETFKK